MEIVVTIKINNTARTVRFNSYLHDRSHNKRSLYDPAIGECECFAGFFIPRDEVLDVGGAVSGPRKTPFARRTCVFSPARATAPEWTWRPESSRSSPFPEPRGW